MADGTSARRAVPVGEAVTETSLHETAVRESSLWGLLAERVAGAILVGIDDRI